MANTWEFNFINDGHLLSVQTLALGSSLLIFFFTGILKLHM